MKITDIIIRKQFSSGPLYGIVSVILDDQLAVHDIKVAKRSSGNPLALMPKRTDAFGQIRDVVHPTDEMFRAQLEREIAKKMGI